MFRGQFEHNMDEKGRVSLPAKFKEYLLSSFQNSSFILTTHIEPCLLGYPLPEWEKMEQDILKLPTFDQGATALRRLFLGPATECSIDKNGRFLIGPTLREHASCLSGQNQDNKEIIFIGMTNKFEIWSKPLWQSMVQDLKKEETLKKVQELIVDLSI